jgi:hypothetical protein
MEGGRLSLAFAARPYPFDADRGRNEENFIPRDIAGLDPAQNLSDKIACASRARRLGSD